MTEFELRYELERLKKQKKVLLEATTYSSTLESKKAISSILQDTNENISRINKLLSDMGKED